MLLFCKEKTKGRKKNFYKQSQFGSYLILSTYKKFFSPRRAFSLKALKGIVVISNLKIENMGVTCLFFGLI
jgi:hypothetical protein